jgi:hypothetical protein
VHRVVVTLFHTPLNESVKPAEANGTQRVQAQRRGEHLHLLASETLSEHLLLRQFVIQQNLDQ